MQYGMLVIRINQYYILKMILGDKYYFSELLTFLIDWRLLEFYLWFSQILWWNDKFIQSTYIAMPKVQLLVQVNSYTVQNDNKKL